MAKPRKLKPLELRDAKCLGVVERPSLNLLYNTAYFEEWRGQAKTKIATGKETVWIQTTVYRPVLEEKNDA